MKTSKTVLILGSAPDVAHVQDWPKDHFSAIVAINNAWRVRADWDYHIAPDDFPADRMPNDIGAQQVQIGSEVYVPANNAFGGIVYTGATMAFTTGYWALSALRPDRMVFAGCDMVYPPNKETHFYGKGTADPLRDDVTLRNLEAKSARLKLYAARQGCLCVRAPSPQSRLLYETVAPDDLNTAVTAPVMPHSAAFSRAEAAETALGYRVSSGRYWEEAETFCVDAIDRVDQLWLTALDASEVGQLTLAQNGAA